MRLMINLNDNAGNNVQRNMFVLLPELVRVLGILDESFSLANLRHHPGLWRLSCHDRSLREYLRFTLSYALYLFKTIITISLLLFHTSTNQTTDHCLLFDLNLPSQVVYITRIFLLFLRRWAESLGLCTDWMLTFRFKIFEDRDDEEAMISFFRKAEYFGRTMHLFFFFSFF